MATVGATVEESAMVADTQDGTLREVDILITVPAGGRDLRIGIECRDHKRRADLQWIEQVKSKYELLPVDRRVVVSRRGFSATALTRARLWSIETLTMGAARKIDWASPVLRLQHVDFTETTYVHPSARLAVAPVPGRSLGALPPSDQLILHFATGQSQSLQQFLRDMWGLPGVRSTVDQLHAESSDSSVDLSYQMSPGCSIQDAAGQRWELTTVTVNYRRVAAHGRVMLEHGRYGSRAVATGSTTLGDSRVAVVLSQTAGEAIRGSATIHDTTRDLNIDMGSLDI